MAQTRLVQGESSDSEKTSKSMLLQTMKDLSAMAYANIKDFGIKLEGT